MTSLRRILVAGATGKQGGALISALLSSQPTPPFHIIALTRNANSARAKALAQRPDISILEGDMNNPSAIFSKLGSQPLYGVFSVQTPLKPKVEEAQGKALVDAAAAHGVEHFIYTSAERGGPQKSDVDGTPIPHFISKFNIENHLKAVAAKTPQMRWTIIRPVAFMDNLTPDFLGKGFTTMWELNGMDHKLQLVPSASIGVLAAEAFKAPTEYSAKAVSLATDELSLREAQEIFNRVVGEDMPRTYHFVGRMLKFMLHEQLGMMFDWFKSDGFGADPKEYTAKYPQMQNFETWLKESSAWKK